MAIGDSYRSNGPNLLPLAVIRNTTNMKNYHLYFYLLLVLTACAEPKNTHISGVFDPDSTDHIYIYDLNYFTKNDGNLIIDSINIQDDKSFSYALTQELPKLLYLSTTKATPPTAKFLKDHPEAYYFSFCSNYYSNGVYLFADPGNSISITWIKNDWSNDVSKDSIIYGSTNGDTQQFLRDFYVKVGNEEFDEELRIDGGFKNLNPKEAFELIHLAKEKMKMYASDKMPQNASARFKNYIGTEIELGSINQFLNWYEYVYSENLTKDFKSKSLPKLYTDCYEISILKNWNPNSIEFYKFVEKYITFKINSERGSFKEYYASEDLKTQQAANLPYENIRNLYLGKYHK